MAAPSGWQDWQRWVEDVDWSDSAFLAAASRLDGLGRGAMAADPVGTEVAAWGRRRQSFSLTLRAFEED